MREAINCKLALGTVQFGKTYGVSNSLGKVGYSKAKDVLQTAKVLGIDTLDTAIVYGNSESVLGKIGVRDFKVITKLPPLPEKIRSVENWVMNNVLSSLSKLKLDRIYGLLLHKSNDFLGKQGVDLHKALLKLKDNKIIFNLGVSIYDPEELDKLEAAGVIIDIVQAPFNLLDRRIESSGWLNKLKLSNIEIHVRSVFLQGLLLIEPSKRNKYFSQWNPQLCEFDSWIKDTKQSALSACINFVKSYPEIGKIVVGVENAEQLNEIFYSILNSKNLKAPCGLQINDLKLINPSNWNF